MGKNLKIDEDDALRQLDSMDEESGVNTAPTKPKKSLGKIKESKVYEDSTISLANNLGWKVVPFDNLPSRGLAYPDNSEIAIKAASVGEIRHWSTIDETDNVSINDRLNFILEKCLSFKIKGAPVVLDWRDLTIIDRFFLIFRIHELTFPNGVNQMMKHFSCSKCPTENKYSEVLPIRSAMLQLYTFPDEVMTFYKDEHKAFIVESQKFEPFFLCLPTLGANEKIRTYLKSRNNSLKDDWFIKVAPYLIDDYRSADNNTIDRLRIDSLGWHENKFMFITKAVEMLEAGKSTTLGIRCPKCDNPITQNIFTSPSFTIKNLFIVSTRLADLI